MLLRPCLASAVATAVLLASTAARPRPVQNDALVRLLSPPMAAVVRLVTAEQWNPRLDEVVQRAPAAAPLGARWTPAAPAWQKARSDVGARMARLFEAFASGGDLPRALAAALDANVPGADAAALLAALQGPAGPSIVRFEASSQFVLQLMAGAPGGPAPGGADWMARYKELSRTFNERIGADVPAGDAARADEVMTFTRGPAGTKFRSVWMSVIGKATTAFDGAMNLMLFDDRDAIMRDIAQAAATVK
jgi:hypothetical protein